MSKEGYVYVLTNSCIKELPYVGQNGKMSAISPVKIGKAVNIENRMGVLNGAVPVDFKLEMLVRTKDCYGLETYIHQALATEGLRYGCSEFFMLERRVAKNRVRELAMKYHREKHFEKPVIETKIAQLGRAGATVRRMVKQLYGEGVQAIRFRCRAKGANAVGFYCGKDAFVVEKGSRICVEPAPSFCHSEPLSYYERWKCICLNGLENGCLKKDERFGSRAEAASIVCASTRNGNEEWREEDGKHRPLGAFFGV